MITCTRRIQFCAGHRVHGHESKCRNLHGHNYVAFFYARAPILDPQGRIIDFGVLKEKLGGWIDDCWDHGMILFAGDDLALAAAHMVPDQKIFVLPVNPTAENMAAYLLRKICPDLMKNTGVAVYKVVLWETENCFASDELQPFADVAIMDEKHS